MESWRMVWREGLMPGLSVSALEAVRDALINDDSRLIQGATTSPPPLMANRDCPLDCACLIGVAGWLGEGLDSVGKVEEYFGRVCMEADRRIGEEGACRWFLNWFDDTDREEMRYELVGEIERELECRLDPVVPAVMGLLEDPFSGQVLVV